MSNPRNLSTTPVDCKQAAQPIASPLLQMAPVLQTHLVDHFLDLDHNPKTLATLSRTCRQFHLFYQSKRDCTYLKYFLRAVIDNKKSDVKRILSIDPTLLLKEPDPKMVVQSQYTWQQFYAENALTMAVKRRQWEMVRILLSYVDRLPQTDHVIHIKTHALSHYQEYLLDDQKHLVIPWEYIVYLQTLIDQFCKETFPNSVHLRATLSDETESLLQQFRDIVLPNYPIKIDDYFDTDLFLYAALKAQHDHVNRFANQHQQEHFFVKVVGFIQGLLTPENAAIWCDGMHDYAKEAKPISDRAARYQVWGGASFYRPNQTTRTDLGYEHLCSGISTKAPGIMMRVNVRHHEWGVICQAKSTAFKADILSRKDENCLTKKYAH